MQMQNEEHSHELRIITQVPLTAGGQKKVNVQFSVTSYHIKVPHIFIDVIKCVDLKKYSILL